MQTREVVLKGWLGEKYSKKPIEVVADTTQQVIRALTSIFGVEFRKDIREGKWNVCKDKVSAKTSIDEKEVGFSLGSCQRLVIRPAVIAKSSALRVILGVVLVVVGVYFNQPWLVNIGAAMIVGGVAEMLMPKPKVDNGFDQAGSNPSFIFNGTMNVTEPGGPTPIVYGRFPRASSIVLSNGQYVEAIPVESTPA